MEISHRSLAQEDAVSQADLPEDHLDNKILCTHEQQECISFKAQYPRWLKFFFFCSFLLRGVLFKHLTWDLWHQQHTNLFIIFFSIISMIAGEALPPPPHVNERDKVED